MNFSNFFDLSLKDDVIRNLFVEIDSDQNGILLFKELEDFYKKDYHQCIKALEIEKQQKNTQNEIFNHLIKVQMQRGITHEKLFEQIDPDKIGFVDVEEFHDNIEWMGFTIMKS